MVPGVRYRFGDREACCLPLLRAAAWRSSRCGTSGQRDGAPDADDGPHSQSLAPRLIVGIEPRHAAGLSRSSTPSSRPSWSSGTTSSERAGGVAGDWPGNAADILARRMVSPAGGGRAADASARGMRVQAGCPGTARAPVSVVYPTEDRNRPSSTRARCGRIAAAHSPWLATRVCFSPGSSNVRAPPRALDRGGFSAACRASSRARAQQRRGRASAAPTSLLRAPPGDSHCSRSAACQP